MLPGVAVDGFDTASIGFIAPAIRAEWGLSPAALAPLFGAGLFGLMAGAFLFGPLADRFGRQPVLVFSVAFFGLGQPAVDVLDRPGDADGAALFDRPRSGRRHAERDHADVRILPARRAAARW